MTAENREVKALIVGASVAGVRVARDLRRLGFDGQITMTSEEPYLPYDKPPLSKQYLAGLFDASRVSLLDATELDDLRIDLRLSSRAEALHARDKVVVDAAGAEIPYDVCVIATGASARPSPWGGDKRVHLLRTISDSDRLKAALAGSSKVGVIGGGLIGSEVAGTAAKGGAAVTVIDPLASPMARLVGDDVAGDFLAAHHRHGVTTRFGVGVETLSEDASGVDVNLSDGSKLRFDLVVVGIGASTNDGWLAGSGVDTGQGVECDRYGRVVGLDGVYAAGDVARWPRPPLWEPRRVEHWTNAVEQAATVAANIMRPTDPVGYDPVDYVWSDQHDLKLQLVGWPERSRLYCVIGRRDRVPPRYAALYADDQGVLNGAATVNWPRGLAECRRLVSERVPVPHAKQRLEALAVPSTPPAS